MKRIRLFLGRLGSGKSHIAKQQFELSEELGEDPYYIEVSDLVTRFAQQITGKKNPTREEQQGVKQRMKNNPNWLLDAIIQEIERAPTDCIYLSGLREKWIFDKLQEKYGLIDVTVVEADAELRQKRRNLTLEQFNAAEERDDKIGLKELLESVESQASVVENNYEQRG